MSYRLIRSAALLLPFTVLACGDDVSGPTATTGATVQFANATNSGIDVRKGGASVAGASNLVFGDATSCLIIDPSGAAGTGLSFMVPGSTTVIPGFTQTFTAGGNYSVVAYPSVAGGTQFLTINNNTSVFTPTAGNAGLRVFNAAPGSGSLVAMRSGGTAVNAGGTVYGSVSSASNVPAGTQSFTLTSGTGTTILGVAAASLQAGSNYTLVVAPPSAGSTTYRAFLFGGC